MNSIFKISIFILIAPNSACQSEQRISPDIQESSVQKQQFRNDDALHYKKPTSKLNYTIIGTMASEGCPNCLDILVKPETSNTDLEDIVRDLIKLKGTKRLMIDFFTSKRDYTQNRDNGPYFANYMSFEEGNGMTYTLILKDGSEIYF